jgi:hypothetical protein
MTAYDAVSKERPCLFPPRPPKSFSSAAISSAPNSANSATCARSVRDVLCLFRAFRAVPSGGGDSGDRSVRASLLMQVARLNDHSKFKHSRPFDGFCYQNSSTRRGLRRRDVLSAVWQLIPDVDMRVPVCRSIRSLQDYQLRIDGYSIPVPSL